MTRRITILSLAALVAVGAAAFAQSPAPGGTAAQGFNAQTLISKLSLYLPDSFAQGAFGFGGGGAGRQGGDQAGGASSGGGASGQQPQLDFTKDVKLFLTKDQVAKLLPIMQDLQKNPMPTPSKAKKVEADVDAILTAAQKVEYAQFEKAVEKMRQSFSQQRAGGGTGGQAPDFANMTEQQRQDLINSLPADQRERFQQRAGQGGGGGAAQMTPLQRRQRELESFIKALQDYQKQKV